MQSSLVGSVLERAPSSTHAAPSLPSSSFSKAGFPVAQHRSQGKSAFARRREEESKLAGPSTRPQEVPVVVPQNRPFNPPPNTAADDPEAWRDDISRQNQLRVENMTEEEREQEKQEIYERFGSDIGDILRRAKEAREKKRKRETDPEGSPSNNHLLHSSLIEVPITDEEPERAASPPLASVPPGSLSANTSRPSTPIRASRKLRFAELSPKDVHVYESAPSSPRRKTMLALPPSPADGGNDIVSIGTYKGPLLQKEKVLAAKMEEETEPEEGTPEYIRRRYFPTAPTTNPDLEWMKTAMTEQPASDASPLDRVRFDLSGNPISLSRSLELPTHLGLHHHAEGSHAGYTIDDIFLLARSTVAAQRAAMLGVLAGLGKWLREGCPGVEVDVSTEIPSRTLPLLKRILFAGLEVLPERGSMGARGIDVVWHCLVGWESREISALQISLDDLEYQFGEVELNLPGSTTTTPRPSVSALIDAIPLDKVLPQLTPLITSPPDFGTTESERNLTSNQYQILSIISRLAKHSNSAAEVIVQTPQLVAALVNTFLLLPTVPTPAALQCLTTLVLASRSNAKAICDPADALLKFVAVSPPEPQLLVGTLRLYTALAKYGLYSHSATDAQELWMRLGAHVASIRSSDKLNDLRVVQSWADLLESWMVCATDPHRTSPGHDILWSRVVAWGWGADTLALNATSIIGETSEITKDMVSTQVGVWRCIAAWLEGARINGVRSGESDREAALNVLRPDFEAVDGTAKRIVTVTVERLKAELDVLRHTQQVSTLYNAAIYASSLAAILRLSLACSPTAPAFDLPISLISQLCASLVTSPLWTMAQTSSSSGLYAGVLCRQFSLLLSLYLRFAQSIPGSTEDTWLAQAFAIILRLRVGDEDFTLDIVGHILRTVNNDWTKARGLAVPQVIWERGGLEVLLPILQHIIQPTDDIRLGPLITTPKSLLEATTLRVPTSVLLTTDWNPSGLPLHRDWMLSALDHILRSGHEASVFKRKGVSPESWEASETEMVRASLLLCKLGRELVQRFAAVLAGDVCVSRSEAIFACMKVFMLEHEQDHDKGAVEVFRDTVVGQMMNDLVAPFSSKGSPAAPPIEADLEEVSRRFLGSTPFFQFYTDFVALYDAISFSHPLFTRLLVPPTSMKYAIDYRKHLWVDFGHLIKNVRIPLDAVISTDLREYLYPVETNTEMILAYVRVLVTNAATLGFTRFVALHHVACSLWADLGGVISDEAAKKLFNMIVTQGTSELIREVMSYSQRGEEGSLLLPSSCFEVGEETKIVRIESIRRWCADSVANKITALYN